MIKGCIRGSELSYALHFNELLRHLRLEETKMMWCLALRTLAEVDMPDTTATESLSLNGVDRHCPQRLEVYRILERTP